MAQHTIDALDNDVQQLKTLNTQLQKLLADPHPGLFTWKSAVVSCIDGLYLVITQSKVAP